MSSSCLRPHWTGTCGPCGATETGRAHEIGAEEIFGSRKKELCVLRAVLSGCRFSNFPLASHNVFLHFDKKKRNPIAEPTCQPHCFLSPP